MLNALLPAFLLRRWDLFFRGSVRDTQFSLGNFYLKAVDNCVERGISHSPNMLFLVSHDIYCLGCYQPLGSPSLWWNSLLFLAWFMGSNLKREINVGVGVMMVRVLRVPELLASLQNQLQMVLSCF